MSSRGLLLLSAVAALSVVVAVVDAQLAPRPELGVRRAFDGHPRASIERARWHYPDGDLVVERGANAFVVRSPVSVPMEQGALDAFVGALWTAEIMREIESVEPSSKMVRVEITSDGRTWSFELGVVEDGARAVPLAIDGRAFLLPASSARDLCPSLDELRARYPLADASMGVQAMSLSVVGGGQTTVMSSPWRVEGTGLPGPLLADSGRVMALASAVARVAYDEFGPLPESAALLGEIAVTTAAGASALELWDSCGTPGSTGLRGPLGTGCASGIAELLAAVREPGSLIDRHLLVAGRDGEIESVAIERGGERLELRALGGWRANGHELEPELVLAVLQGIDELMSGGDFVPLPADVPASPSAVVEISTAGARALVLRFYQTRAGAAVRRDDEAVLWPLRASVEPARFPTSYEAFSQRPVNEPEVR